MLDVSQSPHAARPAGTKGIQSIDRAAAILEIIAQEGGGARLQTIALGAGLKKTTAHNILATLEKLGYVRRRETDTKYYLGERIMNLARIVGDDGSLRAHLRPALEAIAERTGETVYLAAPSGDQVYYIDGIDRGRPNEPCSRIGKRFPLERSAIGLVFLAFMPGLRRRVLSVRGAGFAAEIQADLENVRQRGFALDFRAQHPDVSCVAVPIFADGLVQASFGMGGPSIRLTREVLNEAAWMMIKLAADIQLGRSNLRRAATGKGNGRRGGLPSASSPGVAQFLRHQEAVR